MYPRHITQIELLSTRGCLCMCCVHPAGVPYQPEPFLQSSVHILVWMIANIYERIVDT